jgi:hypothetical protein
LGKYYVNFNRNVSLQGFRGSAPYLGITGYQEIPTVQLVEVSELAVKSNQKVTVAHIMLLVVGVHPPNMSYVS